MEIPVKNTKNNEKVLCSVEDYDKLMKYTWSVNSDTYCVTRIDGKTVRLHRFILEADKQKMVDHINSNRLDNRRENLRITDSQGNGENKQKRKGTSSRYVGVSKIKSNSKFKSKIRFKGKEIHLGTFDLEESAAEAYDLYIVKHSSPSNYKLNFPEKIEDYKKRDTDKTEYIGVFKKDEKFISNMSHKMFETSYEAALFRDKYIIDNKITKHILNFSDENRNIDLNIKTVFTNYEQDANIILLNIKNSVKSVVLINKSDYDKIKFLNFWIHRGRVVSKKGFIHRLIMEITDPDIYIDHKDGNPLNNTRENLRISNPLNNSRNRKKQIKKSSSKFIGVIFEKSRNKWRANIFNNGKSIMVGRYTSEIEAATKRDEYILSNFPESHFRLNLKT